MPVAQSILIAGLGERVDTFLAPILQDIGYHVSVVAGMQPLRDTMSAVIDLVILDLPSPGELPMVADVRRACPSALLVIGPPRNERLLVDALEQGADDYVHRPFRTDELLARIRAQLRRRQRNAGPPIGIGQLTIDPAGRHVSLAGAQLDLDPEGFTLLCLLAYRSGHYLAADLLVEQLWGRRQLGDPAALSALVRRLRELIEPNAERPQLLHGDQASGYALGPG